MEDADKPKHTRVAPPNVSPRLPVTSLSLTHSKHHNALSTRDRLKHVACIRALEVGFTPQNGQFCGRQCSTNVKVTELRAAIAVKEYEQNLASASLKSTDLLID